LCSHHNNHFRLFESFQTLKYGILHLILAILAIEVVKQLSPEDMMIVLSTKLIFYYLVISSYRTAFFHCSSNRVALDYNAAFQSAIAALQYLELFPPITTTQSTPSRNVTVAEGYVDETTESFIDEIDLEDLDGIFEAIDKETAIYASDEVTTIPAPIGRLLNGDQSENQEMTTAAVSTTAETTTELSTTDTVSTVTTTTFQMTTQTTTTFEESTINSINSSQPFTSRIISQNAPGNSAISASINNETIWESTTSTLELTTKRPVVIRLTSPHQRLSYLKDVVFGT